MKKITLLSPCLLLCVFFIVSCSPKPGKDLIGKWQEVNGREALEFVKDGSFHGSLIWDLTNAPTDVSGNFNVNGDLVNLSIAKPDGLTPMIWKVKFSGSDEVTMLFQQGGALKRDGNSSSFRRVK